MDYDKQPINVDEQVALLQNRGLVIEDIVTAKLQLRNISYFRIASYLRYMEEDRQLHHYKLSSTFEQAINLYLFDKELRQLADYPNIDLHAMGFPQGWENAPLWR